MKSVQINSYGGSEVLEINSNTPRPIPGKDQVVIEVYSASVNPIDWKIRAGYLQKMVPLKFPTTLGTDMAGIVIQVGEQVTEFKIGDEVYGSAITLVGGTGAFAEYAGAPVANIALKPRHTNWTEAAALPLVGVSALQALEDHMQLTQGQKILIHGGAGGIGSTAIQLAKVKGAYVATTVSSKDLDFAHGLGADEAIDYKKEDFAEKLKGFDAVFDTVGGETTNKSFIVLKKGGILISMTGQPDQMLAQKYGVTAIGQNTGTTTERLNRLTRYVENGQIKIQIGQVFPLQKVKAAFDFLEKGSVRGKVVLIIKE